MREKWKTNSNIHLCNIENTEHAWSCLFLHQFGIKMIRSPLLEIHLACEYGRVIAPGRRVWRSLFFERQTGIRKRLYLIQWHKGVNLYCTRHNFVTLSYFFGIQLHLSHSLGHIPLDSERSRSRVAAMAFLQKACKSQTHIGRIYSAGGSNF